MKFFLNARSARAFKIYKITDSFNFSKKNLILCAVFNFRIISFIFKNVFTH